MDKTRSTYEHLVALETERPAPRASIEAIIGWGVRAPGNIGSMLRLAANFACPRVFIVEQPGTKHNQRLILRTAVDAPNHLEWGFIDPAQFVEEWAQRWPIVGVETTQRSVDLRDAQWPTPCALMVGGEVKGIPEEALSLCERVVHIPTCGPLRSLNVSHALAIALYGAVIGAEEAPRR